MKYVMLVLTAAFFLAGAGCAPALIGTGAAGAYKVGTDERSAGGMWSDSSITAKVNQALIDAPGVHIWQIDVDSVERTVTLTGVVGSQEEAEQAAALARGVSGVKAVNNYLQVGSKSFGESVDDTVLATRIKTKLLGTPTVKSLNIDVDVNMAVVTLTGIVETAEERDLVLKVAGETPGVARMVDNIKVAKK